MIEVRSRYRCELSPNVDDAREAGGGGLNIWPDDLDPVREFYPKNELRQLVMAFEAALMFLGGLREYPILAFLMPRAELGNQARGIYFGGC